IGRGAHPARKAPRPGRLAAARRAPGAGDATLQGAAWRELVEETGISPAAVTPAGDRPVHIDVHPIPANRAKAEPGHSHIDFRFVFRTGADFGQLQTDEVSEAAWRGIDAVGATLRSRIVAALG